MKSYCKLEEKTVKKMLLWKYIKIVVHFSKYSPFFYGMKYETNTLILKTVLFPGRKNSNVNKTFSPWTLDRYQLKDKRFILNL